MMAEKRKILLIGGAGTLGSDLLDANLNEYELLVVDNFSESALTEDEVRHKVQCLNASVADELAILRAFEEFKPDVVIYLATTLSNDQRRAYESNLFGMVNSIKAAEQTTQPMFIYIQSFLTRKSDETITSKSPIEAKDSYSAWKLAAEFLLQSYSGKKTTLILASVLSPRLSIGAIPAFVRRIQAKERIQVTDTFRDYIDPKTFIYGIKQIINRRSDQEVIVLGSNNSRSTLEILEKTAAALGLTLRQIDYQLIEPKLSDPKRIILENSHFQGIATQQSDIEQCIQKIVNNFHNSTQQLRSHH